MAAVSIKTNFVGVHKAIARVNRGYSIQSALLWANVGAHPVARRIFARNFTSEGSRLGKKWDKLSARTIRNRRTQGFGPKPILVRKGKLKSKVLNTRPEIRPDQLGVNIIWGKIDDVKYQANQGGSKTAPARRMIGANRGDATDLSKSLRVFILRRMSV